MSNIDKVAVIGAGNLGSRHLQALALTKRPTEVTVIDPSEEALKIAFQRWEEMDNNPLVRKCRFSARMEDIPEELDVAVIATSSKPRRMVIENLLATSKVKYLILEKVLFQELADYEVIAELLSEKNVPAWVNCGRRLTDFYKRLRNVLVAEKHVSMSVAGGNWGMGCNSIHMLDIYAFITDQEAFRANTYYLDDGVIDSKRKGYIEFTGELRIDSPKGILSLVSYMDGNRPMTISVDSENFHIDIDERNRSACILQHNGSKWTWDEWQIDIKYQSEITHELVKDLLETGTCGLTFYKESSKMHRVLLEGFLAHLSKGEKERCKICPIT